MSFQTCKTFIHFLNEIKIFMMKSKSFLTLHRQQCKLNVPKPITIARTSVKLMRVLSSELSQDAAHTCHPPAAPCACIDYMQRKACAYVVILCIMADAEYVLATFLGLGIFQLCCCLWRVKKLSDFIKNILICVPKINFNFGVNYPFKLMSNKFLIT